MIIDIISLEEKENKLQEEQSSFENVQKELAEIKGKIPLNITLENFKMVSSCLETPSKEA